MGKVIRKITRLSYKKAIKPLLFKSSPDTVHSNTVILGKKTSDNRALRKLVQLSWSHHNNALEQTIHGVTYKNPVGLSAGFDKNIQLAGMLESGGFGFITGGSVTGGYCAGNTRPWFYRLPEYKSLVVRAGLPNIGSEEVARRLDVSKFESTRQIPLSVSVARTNNKKASTPDEGIEDYIQALKNMQRHADTFEINISCPNAFGGEPYSTPAPLHALLSAVDALGLQQPVYIKMPSDLTWPKFSKLLNVITKHNVKGVTICNLLKDRTGLDISDDMRGGISGKPVQKTSDMLIYNTYREYGDRLTIIGVGGIFTAEDAYRKIKNGASLVALITGLIYEGPQIVGEINSGLTQLLEADGYKNITEAIGTAVK
jgi:dihydroorotate dehydrogenase (fumarate)